MAPTASEAASKAKSVAPGFFQQCMEQCSGMMKLLKNGGKTRAFDPTTLVSCSTRKMESKYTILKQLGAGAQGVAHLVKKKNSSGSGDGDLFVAKETHDMSKEGVDEFQKEFQKMCALRHPNCLRVLELFHFEETNQMFIITEFASGGDLYHYMHTMMEAEEILSEAVIAKMMQQAMKGVAFLHAEGFVHNDLKPDNLLVMGAYQKGAAPRVAVADYGCATGGVEKGRIFFGDPRYMSPEGMRSMVAYMKTQEHIAKSGPNVDVWAMGVTIFEFLGKGVLPFLYDVVSLKEVKTVFPKLQKALVNKQEVKFDFEHHSDPSSPTASPSNMTSCFSAGAQDLLRKMLQKDEKTRCSAAEVLQHDWFTNASVAALSNSHLQKIKFHATRDTVCQILRNSVAAKLRYKHVDHCFQVFAKFDPDNSGTITESEFEAAWAHLCHVPSSSGQARDAFRMADVDGNGSLEFNEFVAITLDWNNLDNDVLDQHVLDIFDTLDEGAREVDVETFKRHFESITGQLGDDIAASVAVLDKDGDGVISLEELRQFIQKGGEAPMGSVAMSEFSERLSSEWGFEGVEGAMLPAQSIVGRRSSCREFIKAPEHLEDTDDD